MLRSTFSRAWLHLQQRAVVLARCAAFSSSEPPPPDNSGAGAESSNQSDVVKMYLQLAAKAYEDQIMAKDECIKAKDKLIQMKEELIRSMTEHQTSEIVVHNAVFAASKGKLHLQALMEFLEMGVAGHKTRASMWAALLAKKGNADLVKSLKEATGLNDESALADLAAELYSEISDRIRLRLIDELDYMGFGAHVIIHDFMTPQQEAFCKCLCKALKFPYKVMRTGEEWPLS